jgi:hypothetical protein
MRTIREHLTRATCHPALANGMILCTNVYLKAALPRARARGAIRGGILWNVELLSCRIYRGLRTCASIRQMTVELSGDPNVLFEDA